MGWLGQPHLLKKLNARFGGDIAKLGKTKYVTPGTLGVCIKRPDISNATRELSKCVSKASTPKAMQEMCRRRSNPDARIRTLVYGKGEGERCNPDVCNVASLDLMATVATPTTWIDHQQ